MKTPMNGFIIFCSLIASFYSLIFNHAVHADIHVSDVQNQQILILKSKKSPFYNQTIRSIRNTLGKNHELMVKDIQQKPALNNADLIISMGTSAAIYARKHFPNTPKIFTFLNLNQSKKLQIKEHETHLLIELNALQYLNFAQTVLPDKNIGILYQKPINGQLFQLDKNLVLMEVTQHNKVLAATKSIIKWSDVLLALPNKNIFNRHSLKGILLSTYQSNTPLISYSPAHVKAGAVAAIYASPINLGSHIAEIINTLYQQTEAAPQRQFAKYFSIMVNRRVAQSLGFDLDSNEEILRKLNQRTGND